MSFKLITPPGMLFVTSVLSIYAAYALLIGTLEDSNVLLAGGVIAVAAVYGAAMVRPWCRYLVFLLTGGFVATMATSIYVAWQVGFYSFQFESAKPIVCSLAPGALMALLGVASCFIVQRQFSRPHAR